MLLLKAVPIIMIAVMIALVAVIASVWTNTRRKRKRYACIYAEIADAFMAFPEYGPADTFCFAMRASERRIGFAEALKEIEQKEKDMQSSLEHMSPQAKNATILAIRGLYGTERRLETDRMAAERALVRARKKVAKLDSETSPAVKNAVSLFLKKAELIYGDGEMRYAQGDQTKDMLRDALYEMENAMTIDLGADSFDDVRRMQKKQKEKKN